MEATAPMWWVSRGSRVRDEWRGKTKIAHWSAHWHTTCTQPTSRVPVCQSPSHARTLCPPSQSASRVSRVSLASLVGAATSFNFPSFPAQPFFLDKTSECKNVAPRRCCVIHCRSKRLNTPSVKVHVFESHYQAPPNRSLPSSTWFRLCISGGPCCMHVRAMPRCLA